MEQIVDIRMPPLEEGTESVVAGWLKKVGDPVRLHEPIVEINTDKALTEVASPATGILIELLKAPDERTQPGDVLGRIRVADGAPVVPGAAKALSKSAPPSAVTLRDLSPAVRSLAKQHGVDLSRVKGTGRGGRITHEDVLNFLKAAPSIAPDTAPATTVGPSGAPGGSRRVPHTVNRRRIAQHMVESLLKTAPHVTAVFEADLTSVLRHREQHREDFTTRGARLTYTAYFVDAAVKALQAVPEVNSRWHADSLELLAECNIGVAVAAASGLVVPVVYGAQDLDLFGIARRLQDLTEKARTGRLEVADLQRGTFTITNHGVSGSLIATPVINQPQSAILGIGKLEKRVVVEVASGTDVLAVRPMVYVTLTIDHRALDGFQANHFLTCFVAALNAW